MHLYGLFPTKMPRHQKYCEREAMVRTPERSENGAAVTVKSQRYCHMLQKCMGPPTTETPFKEEYMFISSKIMPQNTTFKSPYKLFETCSVDEYSHVVESSRGLSNPHIWEPTIFSWVVIASHKCTFFNFQRWAGKI